MKTSFCRRFPMAVALGLVAGLVCTYLASSSTPTIWGTPLMWIIIANRVTIGIVVGAVGVYTIHPVFGFKAPPFLRGAIFGAIVSVTLAVGVFMSPPVGPTSQTTLFWLTIIAGAVYGSIIDMVATWFGGQGKELLWKE